MTPDFQQIFDHSPNAYMVLDRALRYVAANAAYLAVTSSRREDLIGRMVFDVFPDEANAGLLRASFERVLETGEADTLPLIRYRVPRKRAGGNGGADSSADDDRFWSASHIPLRDVDGAVVAILQHTVEVTELERLKATAIEERRAFQQAPGFVCILRGPTHVFEFANAAYIALIGHRSIVGKPVGEALPELESQGFFELLDGVYQTGEPFFGRATRALIQRTKGTDPEELFLDFVYQPIVDPSGKVSGIFVSGHDITQQKRAEIEHRFLAEAIPQQVWTARPDGSLDFVNNRVAEYFGATPAEILGAGWQNVLHPDDLASCLVAWTHSLKTGDVYQIEFRLRRHDGVYLWHLGRAIARRDEAGTIRRWYGTNTDIDAAKRARDELQGRTEFEQQLIGIVAHDLRNPLAGIGLSASILLRRGSLDAQQGQIVARIASMSERSTRLIRDFLDFSQARSVGRIPIEPRSANLEDITRQVVDEVNLSHPEREVHIEHRGEAEGRWDEDRLAQTIGNLVANAFQHSPAGTAVKVVSRIEGERAEIAIHNFGPKIPDEDRPRLFAPFQRGEGAKVTSARSVGLGLYIAHAIVVAHGGTIDVESSEESGTCFTVRLPRRVSSS